MYQHVVIEKRNGLRRLYDWVLHWAETPYGLWVLVLIAFSESSFFPLPPDPLLLALGLAVPQRALFYALACSASSVLGGLFGYLIGWQLWEAVGSFFFAYVPGVTPEAFATVRASYAQYSFWAVFSAGFTPLPYKVFTLAAGVFHIDLGIFFLASALSRTARFCLLGALVWRFGRPIKAFIERYFNLLSIIFMVLLGLGFAVLKLAL